MRIIRVRHVFRYGNKVDMHVDRGRVWDELWQVRVGYGFDKGRVCV